MEFFAIFVDVKMKIVIDDKIPFIRGVFEPFAEVRYESGAAISAAQVRDADALAVRTRTLCDRNLLEGSKVKAIASATIGYDHIDTLWCEGAGIAWSNAPGCNSSSVCQYMMCCLTALSRKHSLPLADMTLGVVGAGHVGGKVAAAARALGMRVLVNDPPRERSEGPDGFSSLQDIVKEADIITLHVPLVREGPYATFHLFDADLLESLRPGQWLINSSRGEVVDNAALKAVLKARRIAGAVLDVWENEPRIDTGLVDLLEFATPHIAGYSAEGKANGTRDAVRHIASRLGLPLGDWSPERLPLPEGDTEMRIWAKDKTTLGIISEALRATYDIEADSAALKADPSSFEALRGNYHVRREPSAYTVISDAGDDATSTLRALGFNFRTFSD